MKTKPSLLQANGASTPYGLGINNRKTVIDVLRSGSIMPVGEITRLSGLSRPTVGKTLQYFQQTGIVLHCGKGASSSDGGKKPDLYCFNAQWKLVCGMTIYPNKVVCGITDLNARVLAHGMRAHEEDAPLASVVENAAALIHETIRRAGATAQRIWGIAVGCDGVVDVEKGLVIHATHFPSWGNRIPLARLISEASGWPSKVLIENSVRVLGYSELIDSKEALHKTFVSVFCGLGSAACVLRESIVDRGTRGLVGEIGHIIVNPFYNELCHCGSKGCFEQMVAQEHILRRTKQRLADAPVSSSLVGAGDPLTLQDIFDAADAGDPIAREEIRETAFWFSVLVHNLILLVDPDEIILQGDFASAGEYFFDCLRHYIGQKQLVDDKNHPLIRGSAMNLQEAFVSGPAKYIIEHMFYQTGIYDKQAGRPRSAN